jgi:LAO/AO transport system ATPase
MDLTDSAPHSSASSGVDDPVASSANRRVLLAKVGLDGHDRGIKVVARGLRDAGFHVIYGGIWQSAEAVAQAALDEDADWLGLSLLSGAHMTLVPRVINAVRATGNHRTRFLLGGIIPQDDFAELNKLGVEAMFGPGSSIESITDFLKQARPQQQEDGWDRMQQAVRQQDRVALARLLTLCADGRITADQFASDERKPFQTIVFTGSAGVGKSSLIAELLPELERRGKRTAVLACDPQSPLTGGALLGDRIRMGGHPLNPQQTLIRSIAVPSGHQGVSQHLRGLTAAVRIADFDLAIIESVGVGQGDVAAGDVADKVVVLLQPESGDDVQWEKAGLLEIADLIVIQKSDLPGADRLAAELTQHFNLPGFRAVPLLPVSAAHKRGIAELCDYLLG